MMLFSIITITKDNPVGFEKTKVSVNSQNFKDYEWIVIDGSIEPDNGIYDAMNKGIDRATGHYLIFMNAGDIFPNSEILSVIADYCPADFIYGDALEGNGFIKKARHHSKIARGLITHHQSMVYRREVVGSTRYDDHYPIAADYKFTIEHLRKSKNIAYVPQALCVFESGGVSQENAKQGRAEQIAIRKEMNISAPFTPFQQWMVQYLKKQSPQLYWKARNLFDFV
jgi:putative colanic acid biosynthesis glycosyltransferase